MFRITISGTCEQQAPGQIRTKTGNALVMVGFSVGLDYVKSARQEMRVAWG